jgi:tetratricopeptide (TPR) repeat protein/tRNA A-37 threonylcarbamoyl transferase component Bud32
LADRYTIERELGQGGMATVYLAHDVRHDRRVAIKVLRPELSCELGADRFVREIHLAARLNHPHILPLFDSGEAGGLLYYVMPLVEGESLRERLHRAKRLSVNDATQIAREVADALDYAHRHGVVHRDVKPENILLHDGHAVVADFGIAKAVTAAARDSVAITRTGVTVGTPVYMSPEQAAGAATIDGRSDLYSLACVVYEMLAGEPPFRGPTVQAVIAAHLAATPRPLAELRPDTPAPVAAAVERALAKDPDARFATAAALLDAIGAAQVSAAPRQAHPLRVAGLYGFAAAPVLGLAYLLTIQLGLPSWVISDAAVLLLVGLPLVVATGLVERRRAVAGASGMPGAVGLSRVLTWRRTLSGGGVAFGALAVGAAGYMAMRLLGIGPAGTLVASGVLRNREPLILADFQNRTADSTLGPSLTAAFRVDLSESPTVRLMDAAAIADAVRRMERPAATSLDPQLAREIALRENVKAVVEGDIDPLGRGYVLSASVVAAAGGHVLTAVRETAANEGALIGAVDRLSRKLRERIGESLKSIRAGPPLEQVTTASLDALRRYSEGFRAEQEGDWERAAAAYRDARAIDTGFATASWRLAVMLYDGRASDTAFAAAMAEAFRHRDRLPEIERDLATGRYYEYYEEYYERGGNGLQQAISAYRAALERDPDNIIALNDLSRVLSGARRYQEAETVAVRAMQLGHRIGPFVNAALAQMAQGRYDDAQATMASFARIAPHNPLFLAASFTVAGSRGDYAAGERYLRQLRAEQRESGLWQAVASAGLAWLDEARGRLALAARDLEDFMAVNEQRGAAGSYLVGAIRRGLLELRYRRRPVAAVRTVEAALGRHPLSSIPILNRPYLALASFYAEAGRLEAARGLLAEYERLVPERNRRGNRAEQLAASGAMALAEGRVRDAIRGYRARSDQTGNPADALFELAVACERGGQPDSALALYERSAAAPGVKAPLVLFDNVDPWVLAATLRRLGELYAARGDHTKARDYYGRFVVQWKDADPELQPVVRDVRARMARLTATR